MSGNAKHRRGRIRGLSTGQPFTASRGGHCRHCDQRYFPGDRIVVQGAGNGAMHQECAAVHGLTVTQMTPEQMQRLRGRR